ncbi:hypothetical protein METBIDRAFT_11121 [Metschnikowia bicuspidata var. bicuspidata NRRL YB-4993]|uniref:Uncharacterized protein n=1 Tax=Metschnikowia bicuspidata var. bicuspidata NRRL YB-4993 TaxID=869754 RepID=A0A1A0HED3_9ASCO|nr:hypothetical protein METBIDRAFT_11121 [Metschnikowia bicuspidata var. bicuspidata NRRL YB-4993]OBA22263.1 hypothetical protein METBIDRAFT_11121 [Metschnikowia bicuspidata var. bicuspidata NRRL YB-4993]
MSIDSYKSSIIAMLINELPIQVNKRHLDIDIAEESRGLNNILLKRLQAKLDGAQKNSLVLKTKSLSCVNRPRRPGLRTHTSKLHLIDDTTLTSLPFPPPAPSKRFKPKFLSASHITQNSEFLRDESQLLYSVDLARATLDGTLFAESIDLSKQDTTMNGTICDYENDTLEETFDDSQDPIVLVEDYMTEAQSKETVFRKKSLANIKKRLREKSLRPSLTPNSASPGSFKVDFGRCNLPRVSTPGNENLEAIFGKIPGSEKLKYCTLCDKPLYEISSVLSSTEAMNTSHAANLSHAYQEFVCWGCIDTYEEVFNELYEAETKHSEEVARQSNHAIHQTSNSILDIDYMSLMTSEEQHEKTQNRGDSTQPQKKRKFSTDLISRLQRLSAVSQPKNGSAEWVAGWQEKLRRSLNNVLTNAFASDDQTL